MPKSTFPVPSDNPDLRTCRTCGERRMPPAMCAFHDASGKGQISGRCLTCCNLLGLDCGLPGGTGKPQVRAERKPRMCQRCKVSAASQFTDRYTNTGWQDLCDLCDLLLKDLVDDFMGRHEVTAPPVEGAPELYGEGGTT